MGVCRRETPCLPQTHKLWWGGHNNGLPSSSVSDSCSPSLLLYSLCLFVTCLSLFHWSLASHYLYLSLPFFLSLCCRCLTVTLSSYGCYSILIWLFCSGTHTHMLLPFSWLRFPLYSPSCSSPVLLLELWDLSVCLLVRHCYSDTENGWTSQINSYCCLERRPTS